MQEIRRRLRLLRKKMKAITVKAQLTGFLALFSLYIWFVDKDAKFLLVLALAVLSAACFDSGITYLKTKKLTITESSLITGLIVGFVLFGDSSPWAICLTSAIAIISKHLINLGGKHIFNPAALGIFLAMVIFSAQTQWKGTYLWFILLPAGLYFSYKVRKLEIVLSYFFASFILFGTQAFMQKINPLQVLGYFSYFFIFIMAIEPKTSPVKILGKIIFGTLLATVIFVLTQAGVRFDAELFGLLALNAATPFLNKLNIVKKGG